MPGEVAQDRQSQKSACSIMHQIHQKKSQLAAQCTMQIHYKANSCDFFLFFSGDGLCVWAAGTQWCGQEVDILKSPLAPQRTT